jgi:hypothetical protein
MKEKEGKPDKSKNSLEDMANSITVESFFSTYVLLDAFLSTEFINKAKSFHATIARPLAQKGLRQGYTLLLVATLDNYINEVVRNPEVIGIEPDLDYRDYWAFTKGRGREITRGALRTDHIISKFVAKANLFVKEILTLESWESIKSFGEKTRAFRDCLRQISEKAYVASKGNRKVTMRKALLESSNMILWSTSCNPPPIAHMYTDYFISRKDDEAELHSLDEMVEECRSSSGVTRLDFSRVDPTFFPRPIPKHWALGYLFSVHESLKLLASKNKNKKHMARLKSLDKLVYNTKHWSDVEKYSRQMTTVYGLPTIFRGYSYSSKQMITDDDRRPLVAEVEMIPSPERLLSIFGNRARIVERGFPGAFGSFECLLDGAIKRSKQTKEAAKVAIVVHKNRWGQEDYSTAIFMPAYGGGWISTNASIWWVFYSIGNNHSGGSSHIWSLVLNKIKRNRKNIDSIVVEASKEEFYRYCEDPGYSRLNDTIVLTNKVTNGVRGVFPELLLSNMLTNMGYLKVRNRIKPKILKPVKGELDTVGFKRTGDAPPCITIFESKGHAHDEDELQEQVNRFSSNVTIIQQNLESFCNELKVPYTDNIEIEAIFVSMGMVRNENQAQKPVEAMPLFLGRPSVNVPDNVKLWDFDELLSQLRKSQVPRDYLELLRMVPVAAIMGAFPRRTPAPGTLESRNR